MSPLRALVSPRSPRGDRRARPWLVALIGVVGACGYSGESGVAPPSDRIFFPAGLTTDSTSRFLFVVNSNSDLRYNGATVAAIDLERVASARAATGTAMPRCPAVGWPSGDDELARACCQDALDPTIVNCDERALIRTEATVEVSSFAGRVVRHPYLADDGPRDRLYLAVRADPSITVVDASVSGDAAQLRCTGPRPGTGAPSDGERRCDTTWRVDRAEGNEDLRLPEEPFALALDADLGTLYVGHLTGGQVSAFDVCDPRRADNPRFVGSNGNLLRADGAGRAGITALTIQQPGNPEGRVWAASRFSEVAAAFVVRGVREGDCAPGAPDAGERDLALVGAGSVSSTAFVPEGIDLRGVAFSADGNRAYLLHRRPSAVVALDLRGDDFGNPANRPVATVEVCAGPTELALHDAGRGPRLLVTCFDGGQMYVVDPEAMQVEAIIEVGRGPAALTFADADPSTGYLASFSDNGVVVVDFRPGSATEYRVIQRLGFPSAVPRP